MNKKLSAGLLQIVLSILLSHYVFSEDAKQTPKYYLNGHTYELSEQKKNWHMAKRDAEKRDGHLVVINSPEEQKLLQKILEDAKNRENFCEAVWIGFSDEKEEGKWEWVNGDKVEFTYWQRNQPSKEPFLRWRCNGLFVAVPRNKSLTCFMTGNGPTRQ